MFRPFNVRGIHGEFGTGLTGRKPLLASIDAHYPQVAVVDEIIAGDGQRGGLSDAGNAQGRWYSRAMIAPWTSMPPRFSTMAVARGTTKVMIGSTESQTKEVSELLLELTDILEGTASAS